MKNLKKDKPEGEQKTNHGSPGKENLKKDKYGQDGSEKGKF